MKNILYLSHDGIFDHIGKSQILPYIIKNSKGNNFYLLTFEKKIHLNNISSMKLYLDGMGIKWYPKNYHISLIGKLYDFINLLFSAFFIISTNKISLVHCRSYIPSMSTFIIKKFYKIKYIFDIRDFWADEGIEIKKYKFIYKFFKKMEGKIINDSSEIVCLTKSAKKYILDNYKNKYENIHDKKISVIPCGTDFSLFNPSNFKKIEITNLKKRLRLNNKKVLLYYGSIGQNYLLHKKIKFFKCLKSNNDWIFLFIVNNDTEDLKNLLLKNGLRHIDFLIINLNRIDIPIYLMLADLSIFFYRKGMRSIGCSPTKLADLFAMNIPIITDNNLGDMNSIIKFNKNKSELINIFNYHQIRTKTYKIIDNKKNINIRNNSKYFNYIYGAKKYSDIYNKL